MKQKSVYVSEIVYHRHKATQEFQRRISYVIDCDGNMVQFAYGVSI